MVEAVVPIEGGGTETKLQQINFRKLLLTR
jgi:hypothetical protein